MGACDPPALSACDRPAPLTVDARCGTAMLFDGRDALGCCQLAVLELLAALLSLQTANFDKDVLRWQCCAGVGRFVPDPVPITVYDTHAYIYIYVCFFICILK